MSPNVRLIDRADGNKGRFCIARDSVLHGAPYCEYYQEEGGWSSAGTVYVGEKWATERMKQIKEFEESLCFPKQERKEMTNEEYVKSVLRTESPYTDSVDDRIVDGARMLHAAMGMVTESGEVMDQLKKHFYYGKPLDSVNLIEEVGDQLWYIAVMLGSLGVSFEEAMQKNISKLKARYPEKFCEIKAVDRDLEKERSILEGNENGTA